jgi:hypothetical protein
MKRLVALVTFGMKTTEWVLAEGFLSSGGNSFFWWMDQRVWAALPT